MPRGGTGLLSGATARSRTTFSTHGFGEVRPLVRSPFLYFGYLNRYKVVRNVIE